MNNLQNAIITGFKEYETSGIIGLQNNPRVLEYFAKVGQSWVHDDETAWCAAFVGFCLETAGIPSTKALNARSYLKWGKLTTTPKFGDIVVFWRISPTSIYGHVAFFLKESNGFTYVLGGNQSNQVCVSKYPTNTVLGYRTL
ncbi:MAG: TIGR02594 family protein [Patescibacteria group bacterium]